MSETKPPVAAPPPSTTPPPPATQTHATPAAPVAVATPVAAPAAAPRPPGAPPPPPTGRPSSEPRRIGDAPRGGAFDPSMITRGVVRDAQRVMLYGPPGIGKSELGSLAPNPIVLDLQDETRHLNVPRVPTDRLRTWDDLRSAIRAKALWENFATVVIDNITRAQQMCSEWVVANVPDSKGQKVDTLEGYGYGKGYQILADTFRLLLQDLDEVRRAGKHIVLVAHDTTESVPNPNGEDYIRFEPDLFKPGSGKGTSNIRNAVVQWADHVIAIYYDVAVERDSNKGKGGGTRTIYPIEMPTHIAKCRRPDGVDARPFMYLKGDASLWRMVGCLS